MWVSHIRALIKLQFILPIEMLFNPHLPTVITALDFVASLSLTFRVRQEYLISHFLTSPLFSIYMERMMLKLRFSSQKELKEVQIHVCCTLTESSYAVSGLLSLPNLEALSSSTAHGIPCASV